MHDLDPHRPRSLAVGVAWKQIILIRHGQSVANAAGEEAEADHQGLRWLDAPVTELGRSQATSWAGVAPTWDVEEVWCSPLVRAMETACRIFQHTDCPIYVTPFAREGWLHCSENRGRHLAALLAGTDGTSDEQRWPRVCDLPGAHKLRGLDRVKLASRWWDPAMESSMHDDEEGLFALWRESIEELKKELMASKASRIALVCHWGVIEALTGVDCENCTVAPCVVRASAGGSLDFSVCPPIVAHPPLGLRGYELLHGPKSPEVPSLMNGK
ncbi:histidine phosphatase superfamily [Pavlovales sp. CCMP2436]|nr:histidine phosphatase superfamily [Pavlovales sp. CCMP2436]|mmetsp:Transcript_12299/g.31030  ORF Transcript_12299/g.31030 Transcript_12299/m.31030 type:complete len:271 (-) Transcript_12299:126-938(-)